MTTSQANKIKKSLLAASEVAKCKLCRNIIESLSSTFSRCYSVEQKQQFLDYCQERDFEAAIAYYVNTMLPVQKKADEINYKTDLLFAQATLAMVHQITPNGKNVIDEAIANGNYYAILKGLHIYIKEASFFSGLDNLLYLICEIARRSKDTIPEGVKHCAFHLLAQYQASRKYGKLTKTYADDTLIYLQDKYQFFAEDNPLEMSVLQGTVRKNDFKPAWDAFFHPKGNTSRVTLADIQRMLGEMDQRHADLVHYLFMCNYIDYSNYSFRDDWMIDGYVEIYNAYYQEDSKYLTSVNGYVVEILKEWQQDANHKYQKAKRDLYFWMTDPIPEFKPSLGDEIETAWQRVAGSDDEKELAEALMPFPLTISKQVETGQYEDAAANIYCLLEHLAQANKVHEDWFDCMWNGGEQTMIVDLADTIQQLYCHLRQKPDLSARLKNEMDIHLEIFNKKTSFYGIDCGDSRYDDMFLDGKKQQDRYSDLSNCYMWEGWYLPKVLDRPCKLLRT